jgi:dihydropteroate synthase
VKLGSRTLVFGQHTYLMGVINVTPDSFSDGGEFLDPSRAIAHGLQLAEAGADILDVGGESTRPGASPVPPELELQRVVPVIQGLKKQLDLPISVDTRKASVARQAIAAGAVLVNDVSGLHFDPQMARAVAASNACCCLMHLPGSPETMQDHPRYPDVVEEVVAYLAEAIEGAVAGGIPRSRIFVDPGIGFGKTAGHNLFLLRRLRDLRVLGRPIVVGTSRKSFLGSVAGKKDPRARLFATIGSLAAIGASAGADIVRIHDVAEVKEALAVVEAIRDARQAGDSSGMT